MSGDGDKHPFSADRRRRLSRRISELSGTPALAALDACLIESEGKSRRIAISGPPGAGKSSLIAAWARRALNDGRRVGVLAIDPSSPISGGSLLGDRIRMEEVAEHPGFFLRSLPSGMMHDGLCPNVAALLNAMEHAGCDDIVLETVGVGQADYDARVLVDVFILVLNPQTGDVIQAMKAGILEIADVLVVNKADLPAAERMVADLDGVIALRGPDVRRPQVIAVSALRSLGLGQLDAAIAAHAAKSAHSRAQRLRERHAFCVKSALASRMEELLTRYVIDDPERPVQDAAISVLRDLQAEVEAQRLAPKPANES